jgi:hypothetical protein
MPHTWSSGAMRKVQNEHVSLLFAALLQIMKNYVEGLVCSEQAEDFTSFFTFIQDFHVSCIKDLAEFLGCDEDDAQGVWFAGFFRDAYKLLNGKEENIWLATFNMEMVDETNKTHMRDDSCACYMQAFEAYAH